jgi:hypothetical protein
VPDVAAPGEMARTFETELAADLNADAKAEKGESDEERRSATAERKIDTLASSSSRVMHGPLVFLSEGGMKTF